MSEDMSNLINQINNMIKNNQIPDEIKNIMNNNNNNSDSNSNSEFDMATMMKMKKIIDSMKEST